MRAAYLTLIATCWLKTKSLGYLSSVMTASQKTCDLNCLGWELICAWKKHFFNSWQETGTLLFVILKWLGKAEKHLLILGCVDLNISVSLELLWRSRFPSVFQIFTFYECVFLFLFFSSLLQLIQYLHWLRFLSSMWKTGQRVKVTLLLK